MLTAVKTGSILRIWEHSKVEKKKVVMVQLLPSSLSPQLKVLTVCEWLNELRHSKKKKEKFWPNTDLSQKRKKERKQLR